MIQHLDRWLAHPGRELLDRADIETATYPCSELFAELVAVFDNADLTKVQELLALSEQLSALTLQIIPVDDHDDSW